MQRFIFLLLMLCALVVAGCASERGKELFDTAQFEEKQHNQDHAAKLYDEIVNKYPGSELARKAEERLAVLKGGSVK